MLVVKVVPSHENGKVGVFTEPLSYHSHIDAKVSSRNTAGRAFTNTSGSMLHVEGTSRHTFKEQRTFFELVEDFFTSQPRPRKVHI